MYMGGIIRTPASPRLEVVRRNRGHTVPEGGVLSELCGGPQPGHIVVSDPERMNRNPLRVASAGLLAAALALSACGGDDDTATAPSTTAAASDGSDSTSGTGTVDANTASVEEMTTAFEAAGVDNAGRWAREIEEYRPYEASDNWAKLRDELSKYNIDDETFDRIISVLEA